MVINQMNRYCDNCDYYSMFKPLTLTDQGALCDKCLDKKYPEVKK